MDMPEVTWWERWTGSLTGAPGGAGVAWAGLVLAALLAGVALGWWLRGRSGRAAGSG